jgi:malonyl-CoA/methylmalonyl-CoA synthetase
MVVGVDDEEFGQRIGAVVTLRDDPSIYSTRPDGRKLLLDDLRKDLASKLIGYKLPTLLRVLDGELPKSQTGKVLKRELGPKLFPLHKWHESPEIQVWVSKNRDLKSKL